MCNESQSERVESFFGKLLQDTDVRTLKADAGAGRTNVSYAAVRLIDAVALLKVPADLSLEQVMTALSKGLTAWTGLNGFRQLKAGETTLV